MLTSIPVSMENKWDAHQQQEPCSDNSLVFICKSPVREGFQYEIYDEFQVLKTLDAPWFQGADGLQTVCFTVLAQKTASKERIHFQGILNDLIGYDLDSSDTNFLSEWSIDYVLQVCGREEFLTGDFQLSGYLWVRHCTSTCKVTIRAIFPGRVHWPLVDSLTGLSSSHEELSLNGKKVHWEDIVMISLWDCERKFRVKLLGFDIPELPSKVPPLTVSSVCSTSKEFTDEVLWNSWLEFDILIRDIPHGAKLGLTINASTVEGTSTKDTKPNSSKVQDYQKGKGQVLYFVNLQLIDHRSIQDLSQGPHTLHMWPFPEWDEEAFTYEAEKLSTATNPDVAKAMAITFMLDRYNFPVVLLYGKRESRLSSPSSETSPTTPFTRTDCLRRLKEESVHYASNLPQFLRTVDWMLPTAVQDVHWLLSHWGPEDIGPSLALELLSVDFADMKVIRLAVQSLDIQSNDDLRKYLLHLVQVKIEPYHDSCLARFLLKRALRSKRIGHFFFWSEVAGCPFFRQRMVVILKACLLGCGEAMLTEFQHQVQVVICLHKVALTYIHLHYHVRVSAPQKLQELLEECNLPSDFQVPFDPRVRAGTKIYFKIIIIMAQNSRIHDSDWLQNCVCMSVFDTGMIEIVRNAITIASVQRSQGGVAGAFKNNALYDWLERKCPFQEKVSRYTVLILCRVS
uniref:Si:rp71-17i16.5 n=1 Tax=Sinocyclocheilus grahami TaxID=75366 RepID=A0A672SLN2_SINGR